MTNIVAERVMRNATTGADVVARLFAPETLRPGRFCLACCTRSGSGPFIVPGMMT